MKYFRLLSSLMVISAIQIPESSVLRATANSGDNFVVGLDEAKNQPSLDLTLEPSYKLVQTPSSTPVPEASEMETPKLQPQTNSHLCSKTNDSAKKENQITVRDIRVTGSSVFTQDDTVRDIRVTGSSVFTQNDVDEAIRDFKPEELAAEQSPEKLVVDAIFKLYTDKNYINTIVRVSPVKTDEGKVEEIQVIEGRIGQIEIQGTRRLNPSYICSRIKLGAGTPLNITRLEEQLRLLKVDPLLANVEASLRESGREGETNLIVRVQEANSFVSSFSVDNYSPPSVGGERFGVDLRYRNLTGIGDELAGSYYRSFTGGVDIFDFSYKVPLNAMNGTLQLRAAPNWNQITQKPFDEFDISGQQQVYDITYRQPLVRSLKEEFALSLGFTYQSGQTFVFDQPTFFGIGPDENGISRTSTIKFSQDYIRRDTQGAWSLLSQFSFGIGVFDATINKDPIPDGRFFSWFGQVQRAQRLDDSQWLIIQAELQLTPDSLLPAQQFVIGGGQSVRGYRQNVRSGDNGFRFSIEDRITVQRNSSNNSALLLIPFIDAGYVWNKSDNPNKLPDQTFLIGGGLGLQWEQVLGLRGLTIRLDYGFPFVNLSDRGNNLQDDGFYFSLRYQP